MIHKDDEYNPRESQTSFNRTRLPQIRNDVHGQYVVINNYQPTITPSHNTLIRSQYDNTIIQQISPRQFQEEVYYNSK